jgi:hypothetical protein
VTALLLVALFAGPGGAAQVRLPELPQLVRAAKSGDEVELERVATRLGPVRLARVAERGSKNERLAALRGLSVVDDGWAVLPDLARLCGGDDAELATAAALAARAIAERCTPERAEQADMPRDVPARAAALLLKEAARADSPDAVRTPAIAAAAALRAVTRIDEAALAKLLGDPSPNVRQTAAEAVYGVPAHADALERVITNDREAAVAAAAAASLCRDVPPAPPAGKDAAWDRALKVAPPARERLRTLAADENVSLSDRVELVGCLRAGLGPEDQKLFDALAKKAPESLKRRARSLGGK